MRDDLTESDGYVRASDLVGCRYRLRQRRSHPDVPPLPEAIARQPRIDAGRAEVLSALPIKRAVGDGTRRIFQRVDLDPSVTVEDADRQTRQAMLSRAHLITNAVLSGTVEGQQVVADIDVLVRTDNGTYMPVIISSHRVAKESTHSCAEAIPTSRLSLGAPVVVGAKLRHHTADGYRVGLAHLLLESRADGRAAVIGQDRSLAYLVPVEHSLLPLREALRAPTPQEPRRLKQCASCRFWSLCEPQLVAADDISLVLPGGKADSFRAQGITTVTELIDARLGAPSNLARAWKAGIPVLRKDVPRPGTGVPRADVEIDIDMEAYLDQGAYLWGTFDGETYQPFVTWREIGGRFEEENFSRFWSWLMDKRRQAHQAGKTFAAYCYANGGENHWLTASAHRFDSVDAAEVEQFIASPEWIDVFAHVRKELVGTNGLGLKILGPVVGFRWEDEDVDGERSVALRLAAYGGDMQARGMLLRYNEDDCRATRAVRDFLTAGAPGIPRLDDFSL